MSDKPGDDKILIKREPFKGCACCGALTVEIRGKFPNGPKRKICPTCVQERLEMIFDLASPNYGISQQVK